MHSRVTVVVINLLIFATAALAAAPDEQHEQNEENAGRNQAGVKRVRAHPRERRQCL